MRLLELVGTLSLAPMVRRGSGSSPEEGLTKAAANWLLLLACIARIGDKVAPGRTRPCQRLDPLSAKEGSGSSPEDGVEFVQVDSFCCPRRSAEDARRGSRLGGGFLFIVECVVFVWFAAVLRSRPAS
jgi:hypothetical protein